MENSQFLSDPENTIRESLSVFERDILQKSFQRVDEKVFIFIDEVQKSPEWASTLKYYTDTYAKLKFVVTGSISTLIDSDATETLVGRLDRFTMLPMKYIEYLEYYGVLGNEELYDRSTELRKSFKQSFVDNEPASFKGRLAQEYGTLSTVKPELISLKDRYLMRGGYPGVLDIEKPVDVFSRLDSDLRTTVMGDMASVFEIRKPDRLLKVLNLAAHSSGSKINVQNIADTAGINRETTDDYLDHLEEFFLINRTPKYTASAYSSTGGREKIHVQDPGILNALEGTLSEEALRDDKQAGKVFEVACRDLVGRLQYFVSDRQTKPVEYWEQGGEVDFVLSGATNAIPIEAKRGDPRNESLGGIKRFLEECDAQFGIVVNDADVFDEEAVDDSGWLLYVPSWLFFLMC
jgi:hypothetical protein